MGKILLYYKYVTLQYPKRIQKWQQKICLELGLTGRIIIAHEGINGTVGGSEEKIEKYIEIMKKYPPFEDIDFKHSDGGSDCFPRLQIKVKNEIVKLGIDPQKVTVADGGIHLSPTQTHELLKNKPENLIILDTRNNYESAIGAFKDAIKPDINYFRQFPEYIDHNIELFKDKEVLMYCTGGVRCERATAYLQQKKIASTIYQIEGGIHRYIEQYPNGFFEGKNYVFDNRVSVKANETILSRCLLCQKPEDEYANCLNAACNKHFTCCATCNKEYQNTCSKECKELVYLHNAPARPLFTKVKIAQ